jgi:hypothetical protein
MECPHCHVVLHPDFSSTDVYSKYTGSFTALNVVKEPTLWKVSAMACGSCKKAIIKLDECLPTTGEKRESRVVEPKYFGRKPAAPEVPAELAEDYNEACAVLSISPKASAALSRRCLQGLLRANGYIQRDLAPAIKAAVESKTLPMLQASSLDTIRLIGNFAAHPMKNTNTGEIVAVEPEEAEWNLEVLSGLFDFYYVAPAKEAARRAALNLKLAAAGKPLME